MSLFYKLNQNNNTKNPAAYGKWFARAAHTETIDTGMLAQEMQQNCTLKTSDIVAVVSELVDCMTRHLQDSKRVYLRGLGTFKLAISSHGVDNPADFVPNRDIRDLHILFYPETRVFSDGTRIRALISGARAIELPDGKGRDC